MTEKLKARQRLQSIKSMICSIEVRETIENRPTQTTQILLEQSGTDREVSQRMGSFVITYVVLDLFKSCPAPDT